MMKSGQSIPPFHSSHRRLPTFACVLVACMTLVIAQGIPPDTSSQAPPQPTGTCRITGRVVAADNGAPVKRSQVTLSGLPLMTRSAAPARDGISTSLAFVGQGPSKQTETGEAGEFEFTGLPPGQYRVFVSPPVGFVAAQAPENVEVTDAQPASLTIKLGRTGVITGRVVDEFGDPLMRVDVRAVRRDSTTGGRAVNAGMGGFSMTDDIGHFRLYGLPPGEYYVKGNYAGPLMRPGIERRTGYGPTYYPGASGFQDARRVTVRAGQESSGIDFAMQRVAIARVLGLATDSTGRPFTMQAGIGGGSVSIASAEEPGSSRGSGVRPDGTFEIRDVTPGDYYLIASLTRGQGTEAEREAAFVPFTINGSDLTINIQTNKGATLSGRVIFEGPDPPAPAMATGSVRAGPLPTIAIRSDPAGAGSFGGSPVRSAQVGEDGTFELTGVRGSIFLVPSGSRGILKSVSRGGQDVTFRPMTLQGTERVTDLIVVLTTEVASIQGDVTDAKGEPAAGATVVVFPEDAERWFANSPFIVVSRTISEVGLLSSRPGAPGGNSMAAVGRFRSARLLPGHYWVVALPGNNILPTFDREALEKLRASATSVTLTAGEATTVQLRIVQ